MIKKLIRTHFRHINTPKQSPRSNQSIRFETNRHNLNRRVRGRFSNVRVGIPGPREAVFPTLRPCSDNGPLSWKETHKKLVTSRTLDRKKTVEKGKASPKKSDPIFSEIELMKSVVLCRAISGTGRGEGQNGARTFQFEFVARFSNSERYLGTFSVLFIVYMAEVSSFTRLR